MTELKDQPTMADYQVFIQDVCKERGWDKRTTLEKMLFLTEEVGELAKAIRKEYGVYGYEKPENNDHLAEELVDVFNYLLDIANTYQIDLEKAFRSKWELNNSCQWKSDYGSKN